MKKEQKVKHIQFMRYSFMCCLCVTVTFFINSCGSNSKENSGQYHIPRTIITKGYVVPADSAETPKTIILDDSKQVRINAGKPVVVLANSNVRSVGNPRTVISDQPALIIPGRDEFTVPQTNSARDSIVPAGTPELNIGKDGAVKDLNPGNFISYNKLQGLVSGTLLCIMQDSKANIWLGTFGGGVIKFDGKNFTTYNDKTGLISNQGRAIFEDSKGNLWFGTKSGVCKFNGKYFTWFSEKEFVHPTVRSFIEDRKGNIWFTSFEEGIVKFDGKQFTHYTEKQGLISNKAMTIIEDKEGNLWIGAGKGVSKFNGTGFINFTKQHGLPGGSILNVNEDSHGNIWIGSDSGLVKYTDHQKKVKLDLYTIEQGLPNNSIRSYMEDSYGDLWFGTNAGAFKYDINKGAEASFTHFTENEGFANATVSGLLQDRNGTHWLSTYNGLYKYEGKTLTHYTKNEGLPVNEILSVYTASNGELWFGTENGGVSKFDGKTFTNYTQKEGLLDGRVFSIAQDRKGNMWFGNNSGVSKFDGKKFTHFTEYNGFHGGTVLCITEDRIGNMWFGSLGNGLWKYDGNIVDDIKLGINVPEENKKFLKKVDNQYVKTFTYFTVKEGLKNDFVRTIRQDNSGKLWLGTDKGLCTYDGKTFTNYNKEHGLIDQSITSMVKDEAGTIWIGTFGYGLFAGNGKEFKYFGKEDGLSSDFVTSLLEDSKGNLWVGTGAGVDRVSKNSLVSAFKGGTLYDRKRGFIKSFAYNDGFLGFSVRGGSTMCEDNSGTVWMAALDRVTAYHLKGDIPDTVPPVMQLLSVNLFNEKINWSKLANKQKENEKDTSFVLENGVIVSGFTFKGTNAWNEMPIDLSLAYDNNYLTFNFIGVTQKQPRSVKYKYMLEGIDEHWNALTNSTEAPYGNLSHGTYIFRVKCLNSEGNWSNEQVYLFTIRPPWWKTWVFRIAVFIFIVSMIILYIKSREKNLKLRQKELEQTVKERTAEVVEQKHLIEEKHKEITDSINYAERIQRSFLATKTLLDENLNSISGNETLEVTDNYFVFFQPKDVVSGDFYWASKLSNGHFALVTADSTGHGVPGAIMSILNISCLENSVKENYASPGDILDHTRIHIIERLKKDGSAEGGKDGMDCSLISLDASKTKLMYAAANNPVWIVRSVSSNGVENKELIELAADKMPVGKHDKDQVPFTSHEFALQKGDVIYTLTDGLPDQFGGPKGKKFMYKKLKEFLVSISGLPMSEQKRQLKDALNDWKGNLEQVDDVCLIGIRI